MKKAIIGLAAIGAVIALRPLVKRTGAKMREHCKQMMAGQAGDRGEGAGMPDHCKQMMGQSEARGEEREPAEPVAL